jgi:hypothetical protein
MSSKIHQEIMNASASEVGAETTEDIIQRNKDVRNSMTDVELQALTDPMNNRLETVLDMNGGPNGNVKMTNFSLFASYDPITIPFCTSCEGV